MIIKSKDCFCKKIPQEGLTFSEVDISIFCPFHSDYAFDILYEMHKNSIEEFVTKRQSIKDRWNRLSIQDKIEMIKYFAYKHIYIFWKRRWDVFAQWLESDMSLYSFESKSWSVQPNC